MQTSPIYTNKLMNALPQQNLGLPQKPVPQAPQISPAQINDNHAHLDDMQKGLMKMLRVPDDDLTLRKIYGVASDMITKNQLTKGKRGATAMQIAKELSSPDLPREGPNGEQPPPAALRQYLINHFNRAVERQAAFTSKFGPPQPQMSAPQPQESQQ